MRERESVCHTGEGHWKYDAKVMYVTHFLEIIFRLVMIGWLIDRWMYEQIY